MDVVALERVHKALGHPVDLRTLNRDEAGLQAELLGDGALLLGGIGRAVVRQELDGSWPLSDDLWRTYFDISPRNSNPS